MAMMIWGHFLTKRGYLFRFFFPLFLIYILLLPIYLLVVGVYLLLLIIGDSTLIARDYLKIFLMLPSIFSSVKGTQINIDNAETKLMINIKWGKLWMKREKEF